MTSSNNNSKYWRVKNVVYKKLLRTCTEYLYQLNIDPAIYLNYKQKNKECKVHINFKCIDIVI